MMRLAAGLLLLINACTLSTEPDLGGMPIHSVRIAGDLAFTARHELRADTVRVLLTIRNPGQGSANMEFGACSFAIRGVGPHGVTWDNRIPPNAGCIDIGYRLDLNSGQSHERLVFQAAVRELLESRPAGRYEVSLFYREGSTLHRLAVGNLQL